MEPRKLTKQMLDFYKTTFDNSLNAQILILQQMESMTATFLAQTPVFPEEGKKVLKEWLKAYKKSFEDFKKSVDENFKQVETFFGEGEKPGKAKTA
jgi:hypothetical protein